MSTQPIPTFPLGFEHLEHSNIDEVIISLLNDVDLMSDYDENWWTQFAKDSISIPQNLIVSEPSDNFVANQIWKIAKNQTDTSYAGKLFYIFSCFP